MDPARAYAGQAVRRIRWAGMAFVLAVVDAVYLPKVARGEPTALVAPGGMISDPRQALLIVNLAWIALLLVLFPGTGWRRRRG